MLSKKPLDGKVKNILIGTSVLFLGMGFLSAFYNPLDFSIQEIVEEKNEQEEKITLVDIKKGEEVEEVD